MRILLIRHGESEANVAHVINDDPKRLVNLTERGRVQAAEAAEKLGRVRFNYAYVSEFARAQQTAEILLRHHGCPLFVDARLNERRSGMDGLPVHVFNDFVRADPMHAKPPHGESFLEQMARLRSFLDEAAARHPGGNLLAVSHENPILAALALAGREPKQAARGSIANCEWVELVWPGD